MSKVKIGIIGGSGLEKIELFQNPQIEQRETKWGQTSSPLITGSLEDISIVLVSRHGFAHTVPPSQVNFRANMAALKEMGCTHVLATTAVGSLREEIMRGDLVIIDQFIDFTKFRKNSFYEVFEEHSPVHTPMADPFDEELRGFLIKAAKEKGYRVHEKGTVVTIEGPRFSTRAESRMFRILGADIINMSVATEAILANELALPYAAIAMSTDYDSWKTDEAPVTWEIISEVSKQNADKVIKILQNVILAIKNKEDLLV